MKRMAMIVGFLIGLNSAAAMAGEVLIDFNEYSPGTVIFRQYESAPYNYLTISPAAIGYSTNSTCCGTPTPALVSAYDGGTNPDPTVRRVGISLFFGPATVSDFALDYNNYGSLVGAKMQAFGIGGFPDTPLETVSLMPTGEGGYGLGHFGFKSSGIVVIRILAPNYPEEPGWLFAIDNLTYNVPSPSTLALLGLGLVGVGAARRK
jgi:hypothetical protein